ncbi:hypothetical protein C8Q80DRAFT_651922 [Daedaleopsis nitida]|nr:hypothetical protein C8Q80DRAFT_651922 [Daedaleopsis nitida]
MFLRARTSTLHIATVLTTRELLAVWQTPCYAVLMRRCPLTRRFLFAALPLRSSPPSRRWHTVSASPEVATMSLASSHKEVQHGTPRLRPDVRSFNEFLNSECRLV